MKKKLSIIILTLACNLIFAQINPKKCIASNKAQKELENNPEYVLMKQNLANYQEENKGIMQQNQAIITIPVVIHIIHRNTHANIGTGTNISNAQIEDQLRVLNKDFSKTNSEFPNPPRSTFVSIAGNPQLQFCLATIDPNGNPTTGITRFSTTKGSWDADDDADSEAMKRASTGGVDNWDPLRYLNMWVCNLSNSAGGGSTLGYAYKPGLQGSNQSWLDGIVVDYQAFGTIGSANSSDGRTPTHEIGHYLNLSHTFCSNGCGDCDNDNWGGNVDDTPACSDIYFGAVNSSTNNNTCNDLNYNNSFNTNVLDMDENYMSYASNTWMFSQGQVDLMLSTLNASTGQGGRRNLKNSTVSVNCISSTRNLATNINLSIYPNPTQGNLLINTFEKIISISVCNIVGKEVISNAKFNNYQLDLNQLSNGIYLIRISTENGKITKKIILSK